ncbi:MAG: ATP-binding protein [Nitrospinae bacterium]|nr:ATP-binding protein [Nitrospinota bacterium]
MDRIKPYLLKHIEDTIVLSILGAAVFVNYFVYSNKLAFLDMFYLLVVLAGYYIGKRFAILGAFFIILMVWVFILADGNKYYSAGGAFEANLNPTVWGGFLILAAWLIGTLSENLRRELQESQRLREDLNHERDLLSISNHQLRDYSFRLEERVEERTQELKQSNQELMDFASIASHDLQEPLRKIVMFGDRLEEQIPSQDVKSRDYLDRMRKAARRMQGFIEDLLKLSAIATGGQPFQTVNLQTLAQEVAEDLEARIAQSNAQLNIDHLPTLEADVTQMRQLLQNLIGNALKYHQDGLPPVVTVTSRPLRDGFWEIIVCDNGIGIESHHISRIFQPFERLHSGDLFDGSGMGLAICKKIVGRHGGSIHVTSQPNEGTSFIVTLPEQHKAPRNRNEQSPQVSSV